ncbi:MAG: low specificity L-threonine aldolase [Oscillospiraceae bacterium]|nr:low specificity L-threonine aldolase [Oscillospiraceae bacterium]
MLSFENDYIEGACEEILRRLLETNYEQLPGYGQDRYSLSAAEKIRGACACPGADVFLLSGGTQTNAAVLAALMSPYEGVIAAETGHVSTHEAGAIEYTGHKVLTLPQREGKLDADELNNYVNQFYADPGYPHMVQPGAVYISQATEYGTVYSLRELEALSAVCRRHALPLYLDGARLGCALAARDADMTFADVARLCDAFYIGGTKNGALCGEAVVFPNGAPAHFFTTVKQHGALLAKGRLLGVQFDVLFTDDLYLRLARHAVDMAERMERGLRAKGCEFYVETTTNQKFPVLDAEGLSRLEKAAAYTLWERLPDGRSVVRLAASWATRPEDVDLLIGLM